MSRVINCDPGGEYLIPFSERKVRAFHDEMLRTKVASLYRVIMVDDATRIHISVLAVGNGVFIDKIRITAGGGTVACIFDLVAHYSETGIDYDPALLDPDVADFGLIMPPDIMQPKFRGATADQIAAWAADGSDPLAVPGMHVNYAYEAQYPSEYMEKIETLTPNSAHVSGVYNTAQPTCYLSSLEGGTFIVQGTYYSEDSDPPYTGTTWGVTTWITKTRGNKNLVIRKAETRAFQYVFGGVGGSVSSMAFTAMGPIFRSNGAVGICEGEAYFDGVGYQDSSAKYIELSPDGTQATKVQALRNSGGDPEGDGGVSARRIAHDGAHYYLGCVFPISTPPGGGTGSARAALHTELGEIATVTKVYEKDNSGTSFDLVAIAARPEGDGSSGTYYAMLVFVPHVFIGGTIYSGDLVAVTHAGEESLVDGQFYADGPRPFNSTVDINNRGVVAYSAPVGSAASTSKLRIFGTLATHDVASGDVGVKWTDDGHYCFGVTPAGEVFTVLNEAGELVYSGNGPRKSRGAEFFILGRGTDARGSYKVVTQNGPFMQETAVAIAKVDGIVTVTTGPSAALNQVSSLAGGCADYRHPRF